MMTNYEKLEEAALLESKANWNELLVFCDKWTKENSKNHDAWQGLGNAYLNLGKLSEAEEAFIKGISVAPRYPEDIDDPFLSAAPLYYRLGNLYRKMNLHNKAIESFIVAAKNDPTSPDIFNDLGVTYFEMTPNDIKSAFDAFKNAVRIDPTNINSLLNLGRVYAMCNLSEGVDQIYNMIEKIDRVSAKEFFLDAKKIMAS